MKSFIIKSIAFLASCLLFAATSYAQTSDLVTLTVSADGPTKTDAVKNALRSAIEQTYGAFVSANTSILNDNLVKDEIVTISTGNINSYEELSSMSMPDGRWFVSLRARVSISKLVSYAQSKGAETEFAGAAFGMNMKMKELNKQSEIKILDNLLLQVKALMPYAFDTKLQVGQVRNADPSMVLDKINEDDELYNMIVSKTKDAYSIDMTIFSLPNKNTGQLIDLILNTFESLSLPQFEASEIEALNMDLYTTTVHLNGIPKVLVPYLMEVKIPEYVEQFYKETITPLISELKNIQNQILNMPKKEQRARMSTWLEELKKTCSIFPESLKVGDRYYRLMDYYRYAASSGRISPDVITTIVQIIEAIYNPDNFLSYIEYQCKEDLQNVDTSNINALWECYRSIYLDINGTLLSYIDKVINNLQSKDNNIDMMYGIYESGGFEHAKLLEEYDLPRFTFRSEYIKTFLRRLNELFTSYQFYFSIEDNTGQESYVKDCLFSKYGLKYSVMSGKGLMDMSFAKIDEVTFMYSVSGNFTTFHMDYSMPPALSFQIFIPKSDISKFSNFKVRNLSNGLQNPEISVSAWIKTKKSVDVMSVLY